MTPRILVFADNAHRDSLNEQVAVGRAHDAFEGDGSLKEPPAKWVGAAMARLVDVTRRLRA